MSQDLIGVGLISGGLDSTVVAAHMQQTYQENYFLFCNYGQKTLEREMRAFHDICDYFQPTDSKIVDLTWMRSIGRSALFEEETLLNEENRKREYVPFRNACLLAAGVALAETVEADAVLIGSTGGDTTCPDNSPSFIKAFQGAVTEGTMTDRPITIEAPLITLDKVGVVSLGKTLKAPFELSWSCHNNGGDIACGQCSNCSARQSAFQSINETDPIRYE